MDFPEPAVEAIKRTESRGRVSAATIGAIIILLTVLGACSPGLQPPGPGGATARMTDRTFVTRDGLALPLAVWAPVGRPKAVILALHGFNDYRNAFAAPAARLVDGGIQVYAYDQRGFGAAPYRGRWPGSDRLIDDARVAAHWLRTRHPGLPLYLMGVSMGGAVALAALAGDDPPPVDGAILVGPAVWGRAHMGAFQRGALWFFAHTIPWYTLTGQGLNIEPSDNHDMLRALGRDPMVIKETRIDTIFGLVDLMDLAQASAPRLKAPTLFLYGLRDEVIPKKPTLAMLEALPAPPVGRWRVAVFASGYHMLLRDLSSRRVLDDVLAWTVDPDAPLPSRADIDGIARLRSEAP